MPIILSALLMTAPLVHYNDLPNPPRANVQACADQYDRLQSFVSRFKTVVFDRELNRGGRLQWSQANDIRYAADVTARPYMEGLRQIAFKGEVAQCRILADKGIHAVTEEVILPVFGN